MYPPNTGKEVFASDRSTLSAILPRVNVEQLAFSTLDLFFLAVNS